MFIFYFGILSYWFIVFLLFGLLVYLSICLLYYDLLVFWFIGLLFFWFIGLLVFRFIGLLVYSFVDLSISLSLVKLIHWFIHIICIDLYIYGFFELFIIYYWIRLSIGSFIHSYLDFYSLNCWFSIYQFTD